MCIDEPQDLMMMFEELRLLSHRPGTVMHLYALFEAWALGFLTLEEVRGELPVAIDPAEAFRKVAAMGWGAGAGAAVSGYTKTIQDLIKALEAGSYDAAPAPLTQGSGYYSDEELVKKIKEEFEKSIGSVSNVWKTPVIDKPAKKVYPRCLGCPSELSPTMDAYYGRDPNGKKYCDPCRRKKGIK